jgi:hypothetical protein
MQIANPLIDAALWPIDRLSGSNSQPAQQPNALIHLVLICVKSDRASELVQTPIRSKIRHHQG